MLWKNRCAEQYPLDIPTTRCMSWAGPLVRMASGSQVCIDDDIDFRCSCHWARRVVIWMIVLLLPGRRSCRFALARRRRPRADGLQRARASAGWICTRSGCACPTTPCRSTYKEGAGAGCPVPFSSSALLLPAPPRLPAYMLRARAIACPYALPLPPACRRRACRLPPVFQSTRAARTKVWK